MPYPLILHLYSFPFHFSHPSYILNLLVLYSISRYSSSHLYFINFNITSPIFFTLTSMLQSLLYSLPMLTVFSFSSKDWSDLSLSLPLPFPPFLPLSLSFSFSFFFLPFLPPSLFPFFSISFFPSFPPFLSLLPFFSSSLSFPPSP